MKFKIEKNELLKLLKFSEKIINENKSNFNPILGFTYLKISKEESNAICSNGVTSGLFILDNSKIEIENEGSILIRPKLLINIVSKIKENKISLTKIDNSVLTINTETFNAQINIVDENSYPNISFDYATFKKFVLPYKVVNKINQKVSWAALNSSEQTKILNGILFDSVTVPNHLSALATDSYKLAYLCEPIENLEEFRFVLDTNILKILMDVGKTENEDKPLTFYLDYLNNNKNVLIKFDNMYLLNKTIEGNYPISVYNAFNIKENTKIKMNKMELQTSLERGQSFVSNEKNPMVTLNIDEKGILVDFMSYELGSSQELVKVDEFNGHSLKISLNATFLLNLLRAIEESEINLDFESNTKPVVVYSEKDLTFKELVLPLRTN